MIKLDEITGVILAGGDSSRMGTDKALLELDGITMIEHVARTLRSVFKKVVVISNVPFKYGFLSLPAYPDIYRNCGPMGGIHSAFVHTEAPGLFVVACDTPLISKELIEYVTTSHSESDIAVVSLDGQVHPLCGVYLRSSFPIIEQSLNNHSPRLQEMFKRLNTSIIPISPDLPFYDENLLLNFNNPKEFKKYQNRFRRLFF